MAAGEARDPRQVAGGPGGHETRDVDVRRIALSAVVLAALIVVSLVLMVWTFDYFARREARRQPPPASLAARPGDRLPPEPRLQDNPARDLGRLLAEEEALLNGYGWVDRGRGVARIPVERAMELTVQRGLPVRAGVAPATAADGAPR